MIVRYLHVVFSFPLASPTLNTKPSIRRNKRTQCRYDLCFCVDLSLKVQVRYVIKDAFYLLEHIYTHRLLLFGRAPNTAPHHPTNAPVSGAVMLKLQVQSSACWSWCFVIAALFSAFFHSILTQPRSALALISHSPPRASREKAREKRKTRESEAESGRGIN